MAKISVNGKEYDIHDLPEEAIPQIKALQFIEADMTSLKMRLAAMQTAREAYGFALASLVEATTDNDAGEQEITLPENLTFD